jgi:NAD(P)-dependent dehydrogenase (short-subunit alcohol dehydrogenase family)
VKRIFLTGASSGIGLSVAQQLTADGHKVWGTSRDAARLPALRGLHPVVLDLSQRESIARSFAAAEADAGGFDVLINNAGSGHFGPAELMSDEALRADFAILVFGQIQLIQLALRGMRERKSGTIINVSSLASRLPVPFMASYNAAKAAMAVFTQSLSLESPGGGIRFVDLQPADIRTGFNDAVARFGTDAPAYQERVEKAWTVVDRNMRNAPGPEIVACRISHLLAVDNPPPQITVGDVFQSRVAPFLIRFLPMRLQLWGIRKYYGI